MEEWIGILGCGGSVGRHATEKLLKAGYWILGGQRREPHRFSEYEKFSFLQVDVADRDSLCAFCRRCRMVINCVSPSFLYGGLIARIAAEAGATYLDLTDATAAEDALSEKGTYIVASGYVPGLSAFLPKALCKLEFDSVSQLVMYQGGTERCSEAAFADIALSARDSAYGDTWYHKGKLHPCRIKATKRYKLPGFPNEVLLKANVSKELLRMLAASGIDTLYWVNAFDEFAQLKVLMEAVGCTINCGEEEATGKIKEVFRSYCASAPVQPCYCVLGMELEGTKSGRKKILRCELHLRDSARICGYVLAETAMEVLTQKISPGLYFAYEILNERYLSALEKELQVGEYLSIYEITEHTMFSGGRFE